MGQRRLEQARAAVESRLDSIFHGGWVPSDDDDAIDDGTRVAAANSAGGVDTNRRRWRIDPGRRAAAAMVAVVALTAAVVGWRVLADRPKAEALPESSSVRVSVPAGAAGASASAARAPGASRSSGSGSGGSGPGGSGSGGSASRGSTSGGGIASGPTTPTQIVVDVVGKVRRPGVVRLAPGSRVDDAVRAVGGALPHTNLTTLNLARVCTDGEQIVVGLPGSAGAGTVAAGPVAGGTVAAGGPAASPGAGARINLNTATAEQLNTLPGVGPVMAQRILDWRTAHGAFASVDQLKQVSGIGDAKYADMSPLVTV